MVFHSAHHTNHHHDGGVYGHGKFVYRRHSTNLVLLGWSNGLELFRAVFEINLQHVYRQCLAVWKSVFSEGSGADFRDHQQPHPVWHRVQPVFGVLCLLFDIRKQREARLEFGALATVGVDHGGDGLGLGDVHFGVDDKVS